MKVSDILRVKGGTLFTITPEDTVADAAQLMADKDIGSLVVLSHGRVVGMLTFREVIRAVMVPKDPPFFTTARITSRKVSIPTTRP